MSLNYSRSPQQEEHRFGGKPAWLDSFIEKTFFDVCALHDSAKNNKYCTNCNLAICNYCMASDSHSGHKTLRIYRHVYKAVVPVKDIQKFIDCSMIQPFKCNKIWALSLKPRPHQGSGLGADEESTCDTCRRILSFPSQHRYCSLQCKVTAFLRKARSSDPPFLAVKERAADNDNDTATSSHRTCENAEGIRKNKRKGTPNRAPFS